MRTTAWLVVGVLLILVGSKRVGGRDTFMITIGVVDCVVGITLVAMELFR